MQRLYFFGDVEYKTYLPKGIPQLEAELQKYKLNVKLIYSYEIDLDIVPLTSDKGQAMQFLHQKWKFAVKQTVVCGN